MVLHASPFTLLLDSFIYPIKAVIHKHKNAHLPNTISNSLLNRSYHIYIEDLKNRILEKSKTSLLFDTLNITKGIHKNN